MTVTTTSGVSVKTNVVISYLRYSFVIFCSWVYCSRQQVDDCTTCVRRGGHARSQGRGSRDPWLWYITKERSMNKADVLARYVSIAGRVSHSAVRYILWQARAAAVTNQVIGRLVVCTHRFKLFWRLFILALATVLCFAFCESCLFLLNQCWMNWSTEVASCLHILMCFSYGQYCGYIFVRASDENEQCVPSVIEWLALYQQAWRCASIVCASPVCILGGGAPWPWQWSCCYCAGASGACVWHLFSSIICARWV